MRNRLTRLFTFAALAAVGAGGFAQTAGPGGTSGAAVPRQGFSVPGLVAELSLFLPAEATRRPSGQQGQSGQQRSAFRFTRDPKLFLTRDQTAKLLSVLSALRDDPMPTPSRARQVQADIDAILTAEQKAEYTQFRKALEDLRQNFSRSGAQAQGGAAQGDPTQQHGPAQDGGVPLTTLERRQRQLDAFIRILQDRMRARITQARVWESRKLACGNHASSRVGQRMTPTGRLLRAG